jgi:predicted nucleic acid-binding protein
MIEEFLRVFRYPRIRSLFARAGTPYEDAHEIAETLRLKAIVVDVGGVTLGTVPRDPADVPVLATLIASDAEWLVTGDRGDLPSLGLRQIVTASEFLSRMDSLSMPPLAEQPRAPYRVKRERRKRTATAAQVRVVSRPA